MAISTLNADLSKRVVILTDTEQWVASPQPGVSRRPLDRHGAESGRATSIVRYEPGSSFPAHTHPEGEEFLVLEGVLQDESGVYPEGTYVLNPPGSRHAPSSPQGCVLFVKLCQYAGEGRPRIALDTRRMQWRPGPDPGVSVKPLYSDPARPETMALMKFEPGASMHRHAHPGGEEFLVLEGTLEDESGVYPRSTWVRNPRSSSHAPFSREGCVIYLRTGGL
jgi:anti-sigma factor ChrR (cupin superfamily)